MTDASVVLTSDCKSEHPMQLHLSARLVLYSPSAHQGMPASVFCCWFQRSVRNAVCSAIWCSSLCASSFSSRPRHLDLHSKSLSASFLHSEAASPTADTARVRD